MIMISMIIIFIIFETRTGRSRRILPLGPSSKHAGHEGSSPFVQVCGWRNRGVRFTNATTGPDYWRSFGGRRYWCRSSSSSSSISSNRCGIHGMPLPLTLRSKAATPHTIPRGRFGDSGIILLLLLLARTRSNSFGTAESSLSRVVVVVVVIVVVCQQIPP
jgi:hypothetical protein